MAQDWNHAFLKQAKSEVAILEILLERKDLERCHSLHYIQMVLEKLAKGLRSSDEKPAASHQALLGFIRSAHMSTVLRRAFGFQSIRRFKVYLDSLLPIAYEIEKLAPKGNIDKPNPEYPWQTPQGQVIAPCEHIFAGLAPDLPPVRKLMRFLWSCFRYLEQEESI
jgi:hypothetical protein